MRYRSPFRYSRPLSCRASALRRGAVAATIGVCALMAIDTPARADVTYYLVRQTSDTPRVIDVVTCEKGEERPLTSVTLAPRE